MNLYVLIERGSLGGRCVGVFDSLKGAAEAKNHLVEKEPSREFRVDYGGVLNKIHYEKAEKHGLFKTYKGG